MYEGNNLICIISLDLSSCVVDNLLSTGVGDYGTNTICFGNCNMGQFNETGNFSNTAGGIYCCDDKFIGLYNKYTKWDKGITKVISIFRFGYVNTLK